MQYCYSINGESRKQNLCVPAIIIARPKTRSHSVCVNTNQDPPLYIMVSLRRRKQNPQSFRSDPVLAGSSLIVLIVSLVVIFYFEATNERISIRELVIEEERFVEAKLKQHFKQNQYAEVEA
jgi:hypothetical protein